MIGYITLGTNDIKKAGEFYDALLKEMGIPRKFGNDGLILYSFGETATNLLLTKPFDGNPATAGNGVMVAFKAKDKEAVDALHAKALSLGGTDEGAPGFRTETYYGAYFRDLDGNKLNFYCK